MSAATTTKHSCAGRSLWALALLCGAAALLQAPAAARADAAARPYDVTEEREACADFDTLRRPFFGDTHVHTAYSFDASTQDTRNTPRDAYLFARGALVGLQPYDAEGKALRSAQLDRPLDWTVVTDHSEMLGEVRTCMTPGLPGSDSDMCWIYQHQRPLVMLPFAQRTLLMKQRMAFCGEDGEVCRAAARSAWGDIRDAAEEAYDRSSACAFTSFIGYEWTATAGGAENLHRNVVFRNAQVPELPTSWVESRSAFDHWEHLQRECIDALPGCDVLTIPHNSNLSGNGLMFASAKLETAKDADLPVTREEALLRQRWEPLAEIMQHKGDSECLLAGDTTDEACGFEKLPYDSFAGAARFANPALAVLPPPAPPKRAAMVRAALRKGLLQGEQLGVNGLKFGIVASTDTHLGTPGLTKESDPKGHGGAGMNAGSGIARGLPDNPEYNPGGLAVVWAEENTRDAIFAAMMRRETYGTSGTRPVVRFFGGWGYDAGMCEGADFAATGYAGGVPMGGDLPERPADAAAPVFAVSALQDPGSDAEPGTPLERVQVVKGWVADGVTHEKVYDIASSGEPASVDTATCERHGDGAQSLCRVWRDPDFDPDQPAFYYARVLENPSCRWSQYVCVAAGVDCSKPDTVAPGYAPCCAPDHHPIIQERAWTSPIWYGSGDGAGEQVAGR